MAKRYVIYSPQLGIYLGGKGRNWSLQKEMEKVDQAPTFEKGTPLTEFISNLPDVGLELREVVPDRPGFNASMDRLAEAGLPRWGPEGAPPRQEEIQETVTGSMGGKKKGTRKKK
jgi:hypothetical protein